MTTATPLEVPGLTGLLRLHINISVKRHRAMWPGDATFCMTPALRRAVRSLYRQMRSANISDIDARAWVVRLLELGAWAETNASHVRHVRRMQALGTA